VSTFGREADRLAASRRRHERRVAQFQIQQQDAVRFAIALLADNSLEDDALARGLALHALTEYVTLDRS
jgi:hypothetical protein